MIAVRIPEEIRTYKEKIIGGFTARQLIASAVIGFICIPLYIRGKEFINEEIISWIVMAVAAPIGVIGFFPEIYGMKPEKFLKYYIKFEFFAPRKRVFISDNFFDFRKYKEP